MRRLLWKEWRERRLWALSLAASILYVSLYAQGQNCFGELNFPWTNWQALPLMLALLTGAGAYASELSGERATFAFSRPISLRAMLCAKLLFGAIIFIGVPLLAALLLRFTIPAPLQHLATPVHLLTGAWTMTWPLAVCYLFGLGCSVMSPRLPGSILVIAATAAVLAIALALAPLCSNGNVPGSYFASSMFSLGTWLGVLCAGLSVAYFGLTLGAKERLQRFAPIYIGILLGLGLIGMLLPGQWTERLLWHWTPISTNISPGGSYALVYYEQHFKPFDYFFSGDLRQEQEAQSNFARRLLIIRIAERAIVQEIYGDPVELQAQDRWHWITDDTASYYDFQKEGRRRLSTLHIGSSPKLRGNSADHL